MPAGTTLIYVHKIRPTSLLNQTIIVGSYSRDISKKIHEINDMISKK